jgi:hypothetical protein
MHNHLLSCKGPGKPNATPASGTETSASEAETPAFTDDFNDTSAMDDDAPELNSRETPSASGSAGQGLSEYEKMRLKNIARNEAMMVSLGLGTAASALKGLAPATKKRAASAKSKDANPKTCRRSDRTAAKTAAAAAAAAASQQPAKEIHQLDTGQNHKPMDQNDLFGLPAFTQADRTDADADGDVFDVFQYHAKATGAREDHVPDKRATVPEQNVAFAKLASNLNLSIAQSDEILRFIAEFGSSALPMSYKRGICKPIKEMAFAMDDFEHTTHISLTRNGVACPGYTADDTVPLRFSDPLWLAQELLLSPQVMKDKALVHFKSQKKSNSRGERCYSELYTGTWCVHTCFCHFPTPVTTSLRPLPLPHARRRSPTHAACFLLPCNNHVLSIFARRWEETEKKNPGVELLPLIFYLDGTWVSRTGSSAIKPIAMTLGNFELKLSNLDIAKRLVGFMPALRGTKKQRENNMYKRTAAHVYHTAFAEILKSVAEMQKKGGGVFRIHGESKPRLLYPVVALVVQDLPEGHLLTGTYDSGNTPRPCISCFVGVDEVANPRASCAAAKDRLRTANGMQSAITKVAEKLRAPERSGENCKTQLEEAARQALSAHIMRNSFWDVDFGTDNGIYGAVVPDRLHEWWEGIVKYIIDNVVVLCAEEYQRSNEEKKHDKEVAEAAKESEKAAKAAAAESEKAAKEPDSPAGSGSDDTDSDGTSTKKPKRAQKRQRKRKRKPKPKKAALEAKKLYLESGSALDCRIQAINPRTGDASIPKDRFLSGFTTLPSIPAFEIKALLLQLPVALGLEERFLKGDTLRAVHALLEQAQLLSRKFHLHEHTESGIDCLGKYVHGCGDKIT